MEIFDLSKLYTEEVVAPPHHSNKDQLWKKLQRLVHSLDIPNLKKFRDEISKKCQSLFEKTLTSSYTDEDLNNLCEIRLIHGETIMIIERQSGDITNLNKGLDIMFLAINSIHLLKPYNQVHGFARVGSANLKVGHVIGLKNNRSKQYISTGVNYLNQAVELLKNLDTNPSEKPEIPYHRAAIFRDLGRGKMAEVLCNEETRLSGNTVKFLKKALDENIEDIAAIKKAGKSKAPVNLGRLSSGIVLSQAMALQASELDNQKRPKIKDYPFKKADLLSSVKEELEITWGTIHGWVKGKKIKPYHAQHLFDLSKVFVLLFSEINDPTYLEDCIKINAELLKIYTEKEHGYKRAVTNKNLGWCWREKGEPKEALTHYEEACRLFGKNNPPKELEMRSICNEIRSELGGNLTAAPKIFSTDTNTETIDPVNVGNCEDETKQFYEKFVPENDNKKLSETDLQGEFEKTRVGKSAQKFAHLTPNPTVITDEEIAEIEDLLNEVRRTQISGELFDPSEGRKAFCESISSVLDAQGLCIPISKPAPKGATPEEKAEYQTHARSLYLKGDSIQILVVKTAAINGGARSMRLVDGDIKLEPTGPRKNYTRDYEAPAVGQ